MSLLIEIGFYVWLGGWVAITITSIRGNKGNIYDSAPAFACGMIWPVIFLFILLTLMTTIIGYTLREMRRKFLS